MRSPSKHRAGALLVVAVLALAGCADGGGGSTSAGPEQDPTTSAPRQSPGEPSASSPSAAPPSDGASPTRSPSPDPTSTPPGDRSDTRSPRAKRANATVEPIPDRQWQRMVATGVWRPRCPVGRAELRRVEVNYVSFSGKVRRGALVVNRDVAHSVARIFTRLFEERFPIRRMRPVEAYGGDSNASLAADNTSAYNCRRPSQTNAPLKKSPHANGRAIDVNPRENPWIDLRCDCWFPSAEHRRRTDDPGKIRRGEMVWRTFIDEGWVWQNIDVPDYMHFDTGFPSKPYAGPKANKRRVRPQRAEERREARRANRR